MKDAVKGEGSAFTRLEAWEWRDPAAVAERRELQDNAAAQREYDKLQDAMAKRAEQERIRAKVFRKARAA